MQKKLRAYIHFIILLLCPATLSPAFSADSDLPEGFVDVKKAIPSVVLDIRYYTSHNFIGRPIDGYLSPKCILTKQAADALKNVQKELKPFALSLKIYDGYRPQRAVNHFVRWAKDLSDTKTKTEFYPTTPKVRLFKDGFIASRSGHSRGSTVDLTIVPIQEPEQELYVDGQPLCECYLPVENRFKDNSLDMGAGFDCFHTLSWTANGKIGPQQRANRLLLKSLMEKYGFKNYEKEWWHYTLRQEPFPEIYFDFIIK